MSKPNPKPTVCPYLGHDISIERGIKCPYCESVREFGVLETESKIDKTKMITEFFGDVRTVPAPETHPDTEQLIDEAIEGYKLDTDDEPDTKVDSQITIKGETYELASFGEQYSDGSRQATLRLKDVQ